MLWAIAIIVLLLVSSAAQAQPIPEKQYFPILILYAGTPTFGCKHKADVVDIAKVQTIHPNTANQDIENLAKMLRAKTDAKLCFAIAQGQLAYYPLRWSDPGDEISLFIGGWCGCQFLRSAAMQLGRSVGDRPRSLAQAFLKDADGVA